MKNKVILIKSNLLDRETRFPKIIDVLSKNNYSVAFIGWNRDPQSKVLYHRPINTPIKEYQFDFKARFGIQILVYFPFWWLYILFQLLTLKWDIAQTGDFISTPPAIIAGILKRKPVIYEILDVYEDEIPLPRVLRNACVLIDKIFIRLSSAIILADEAQKEELSGIPNPNTVAIYDSPPDFDFEVYNESISYKPENKFVIFFGGKLHYNKQLNLNKMIDAVEKIENVKLIIAGFGDMVEEIKDNCARMPDKVQYIGEITHNDLLQKSYEANLLFILRSSENLTNKYTCGSKIFEAMMCGKPILVNKGTSTARKVIEEKCGIVVDANNIDEIMKAIEILRDDPAMCEKLGKNSRRAYEERYSWAIMQQRLLTLFKELTKIT